jgi:hypothetical protein
MRVMKMKNTILKTRLLLAPVLAMAFTAAAHAAAPGVTGPTFNLMAQSAYLNPTTPGDLVVEYLPDRRSPQTHPEIY